MYKKVREYQEINSFIAPNQFMLIAGPCAIEDYETLLNIANYLIKHGIHYMRAGAYKPRTSPYDFQGLGKAGLEILEKVKKETGIKVVCEIVNTEEVAYYEKHVDIIQVGARNMQNFALLKALGKTTKPILLKRGFASTIDEWLYACEYILQAGNPNVILCERGIKTFETMTRNTLDISSVPIVKSLTKIPVIIDPSHSAGRNDLILPLVKAAIAVGADGVMLEIHPSPKLAKSDGDETISLDEFEKVYSETIKFTNFLNKNVF